MVKTVGQPPAQTNFMFISEEDLLQPEEPRRKAVGNSSRNPNQRYGNEEAHRLQDSYNS
jgi:hypothetical protein